MKHQETVIIIDFGGQYAQLIARRVRECGVYCEILPYNKPAEEILSHNPKGIIFSGGPASVNMENAPQLDEGVFKAGVPILGICYGMQLMAKGLGGTVASPEKHEYGHTEFYKNGSCPLFENISEKTAVWMSHGDAVTDMPAGFGLIGHTELTPTAAMADEARRFYAVQFHPEVVHTAEGTQMLKNFLFHICECEGGWSMENYIDIAVANIRQQVGDHNVLCALSGGVDSGLLAFACREAGLQPCRCYTFASELIPAQELAAAAALAARDTLRTEAALPLYGHEITEVIDPLTAGLNFAVKMDKPDFIGKSGLVKRGTPTKKRVGIKVVGRGVIRDHQDVYDGDKLVGFVSSGTFMAWINASAGMAFVEPDIAVEGKRLEVDVRGRRVPVEVVPLPFYNTAREVPVLK
mgnify:CR=1 FL=1